MVTIYYSTANPPCLQLLIGGWLLLVSLFGQNQDLFLLFLSQTEGSWLYNTPIWSEGHDILLMMENIWNADNFDIFAHPLILAKTVHISYLTYIDNDNDNDNADDNNNNNNKLGLSCAKLSTA